ncbi:MAG: DNA-binding protein [Magnetococcales bacterium]|nr:DNA-binding protein [Magnetococcales bacterium]
MALESDSNVVFIDQHSLANRWGMATKTLRNWRYMKYGPGFIKIGKKVLYSMNDVVAFERMNRTGTSHELHSGIDLIKHADLSHE